MLGDGTDMPAVDTVQEWRSRRRNRRPGVELLLSGPPSLAGIRHYVKVTSRAIFQLFELKSLQFGPKGVHHAANERIVIFSGRFGKVDKGSLSEKIKEYLRSGSFTLSGCGIQFC